MHLEHKTLQSLIESRLQLGPEAGTGFRPIVCACCRDHSPRAGFKFTGEAVIYNCFNCKTRAVFEEGSVTASTSIKKVLLAFGISEAEISECTGSSFFSQKSTEITLDSVAKKINLFTPETPLPPSSYQIGVDHHYELQLPLAEYLQARCVDPVKLGAYFSLDQRYLNRVIIPCYRAGKIIYWQARSITSNTRKYLSPTVCKEAALWGYDNIYANTDKPLFITEGILDAFPVSGVALLGSELNEAKLEVLNRAKRQKVVVIDRDENGGRLGELALANGWQITFPPAGCKDINEALMKHGSLYLIWCLMKNKTEPSAVKTSSGTSLEALLKLRLGVL